MASLRHPLPCSKSPSAGNSRSWPPICLFMATHSGRMAYISTRPNSRRWWTRSRRLPIIGDLPVTDGLPPSVNSPVISGQPGIADQPGMVDSPAIAGPHTPRFGRWWVMGYSMGGRVALSLLEYAPEKIAKLILLAPDGFKMNGWYWLATQSRPGNLAFRRIMHRPHSLFRMLRIAGKLKLLNPGIHKFMFRYIGDPQVREELYDRWTVMRGFKPDIRSIRSVIRERQIPVNLLYGRHDHIIRAATGERFRKGIEPWCRIHVLDAGHGLLQPKSSSTRSSPC